MLRESAHPCLWSSPGDDGAVLGLGGGGGSRSIRSSSVMNPSIESSLSEELSAVAAAAVDEPSTKLAISQLSTGTISFAQFEWQASFFLHLLL
jgi:hypothetical protein